MTLTETVRAQTRQAVAELLAAARMRAGDIFIIGCSSSEVVGQRIGCGSSMEAAQCCEHLNRAIVVERAALPPWAETVNAVPQPHAGGSFATAAYAHMADPVLVENIRAGAGIDIGGTLIGMHLRPVAVPVRLSLARIGEAGILCARTRPKYIGGSRAVYQTDELEVPR